jgi:uncharacterized protein
MRAKTRQSRSAVRRLLIKTGSIVLLLLLGSIVVLYALHQRGAIDAWRFPLKQIVALLGGGGLACFLLAWILQIRWQKQIVRVVLIAVFGINAIAYLGAYSLTHFNTPGHLGLALPRPSNSKLPSDLGLEYVVQRIPVNRTEWLETWFIPAPSSASKGTVLLFPGNGGSKGKQLLPPARVFHDLNYDTLLVDFRGVGGSSGNTTTLGMREAKDVALAVNYARQSNLKHPIALYGVSMGTAAILKAIATENVKPDAIMLELPFARLVNAVKTRLHKVNIPPFPTAELIVFWGSIQHGFNGFSHNPVTYARQVNCPTLIFHGQQDKWIDGAEIDELFQNLQSSKQLVLFPSAGHQLLVTVERDRWIESADRFLGRI